MPAVSLSPNTAAYPSCCLWLWEIKKHDTGLLSKFQCHLIQKVKEGTHSDCGDLTRLHYFLKKEKCANKVIHFKQYIFLYLHGHKFCYIIKWKKYVQNDKNTPKQLGGITNKIVKYGHLRHDVQLSSYQSILYGLQYQQQQLLSK